MLDIEEEVQRCASVMDHFMHFLDDVFFYDYAHST